MPDAAAMKIAVTADGPYAVTGGVPLSRASIAADAAGESVGWTEAVPIRTGRAYFLCRCGHSANKPFCDGAHAQIGFDGTEAAERLPYEEQAGEIDGPVMILTDAEPLCAFARFCDREGKVWNTVAEARTPEETGRFAGQVGECPSGRLVAWDRALATPVEPALPPSIVVVSDPQQNVAGPLFVRGGIEMVGADGTAYEVRNRVTLCRCGASKNKPFCDGSHASIGFTDA